MYTAVVIGALRVNEPIATENCHNPINIVIIGYECSIVNVCLLVSSADNLCKEFGSTSGYKLIDTLMVFLKEFLEKTDFEKYQQTT